MGDWLAAMAPRLSSLTALPTCRPRSVNQLDVVFEGAGYAVGLMLLGGTLKAHELFWDVALAFLGGLYTLLVVGVAALFQSFTIRDKGRDTLRFENRMR